MTIESTENTHVIDIYSDGACKGNPGPGGWGALMVSGSSQREICGGDPATTNNRMEMTAVIRALEELEQPSQVRVHTDSQYVQKGISEWLPGWKRRNWRTAEGKPVDSRVRLGRGLLQASACRPLPRALPRESLAVHASVAALE